jgi:hypothetical protein
LPPAPISCNASQSEALRERTPALIGPFFLGELIQKLQKLGPKFAQILPNIGSLPNPKQQPLQPRTCTVTHVRIIQTEVNTISPRDPVHHHRRCRYPLRPSMPSTSSQAEIDTIRTPRPSCPQHRPHSKPSSHCRTDIDTPWLLRCALARRRLPTRRLRSEVASTTLAPVDGGASGLGEEGSIRVLLLVAVTT